MSQNFWKYKEFSNGGCIEIMNGYVKKSDHKDLISIATYFAKNGHKVHIPTAVHYKDDRYKQVFGDLIDTVYERKCPDLIIDGKFYEYESYTPPFRSGKMANMISHSIKQSNRIIINNNKGCTDRFVINNIGRRLHDKSFSKYSIEEVWVYEKGKVRRLW
ncbi:hypothetical protein FACS189452_09780 [Bacteroidia bacterium]|nr:hypothetical protein FACS189452_09780 [Bacteroidia bacterium]GHT80187.1 hypothetical protein FACS189467_1700 [Bacteroidia bacterium]